MKTSKEFCDLLRDIAIALADGKQDEVKMPLLYVHQELEPEDAKKITAAYARTIMNRVPDVKEIGSVSVKTKKDEDDGSHYFLFTLNREKKRKVFTDKDLPAVRAKVIEKVLKLSPDLSHLEPGGVVVAVDTIKRFKDLIREMFDIEANDDQ